MQATNPITEHSTIVSRQHAHRPDAAALRASIPGSGQPAANDARPASRSRVLDGFRDMAHGIATPLAEQQTRAFYRSSGQVWAHPLAEQTSGGELRARVVEAFRAMVRGAQDDAAHASTLQFYRSSGQAWASRLG